jgi:hypothetical protein
MAAFQTVGSSKTIHVSEAELQRAQTLLKERDSDLSSFITKKPPMSVFQSADSAKIIPPRANQHQQDSILTPSNHLFHSCSKKKLPMSGFRTTGSSKTIHVSEASLERAQTLLQETNSDLPPLGETKLPMAEFHTADSNKLNYVSEVNLERVRTLLQERNSDSLPLGQNSPPLAAFQTAGSSKSLHVSEASLQRARELLRQSASSASDGELQSSIDNKPPLTDLLQDFYSDLRPLAEKKPGLAAFQTAGSNKTIDVSEASLRRAQALLRESELQPPSDMPKPLNNKPQPGDFQMASSRKTVDGLGPTHSWTTCKLACCRFNSACTFSVVFVSV